MAKLRKLWYQIKYRKQLRQGYGTLVDMPIEEWVLADTSIFDVTITDKNVPVDNKPSKVKVHKVK